MINTGIRLHNIFVFHDDHHVSDLALDRNAVNSCPVLLTLQVWLWPIFIHILACLQGGESKLSIKATKGSCRTRQENTKNSDMLDFSSERRGVPQMLHRCFSNRFFLLSLMFIFDTEICRPWQNCVKIWTEFVLSDSDPGVNVHELCSSITQICDLS